MNQRKGIRPSSVQERILAEMILQQMNSRNTHRRSRAPRWEYLLREFIYIASLSVIGVALLRLYGS